MYNDFTITKDTLPPVLPVFPLSEVLLLPGIELPLNIFEPRYIKMIDDAMAHKKLIGMVQPREKGSKNLFDIGCVGKIKTYSETDDGRYLIVLDGVTRFDLGEELTTLHGYRQFKVNYDRYIDDFYINEVREDFKMETSKRSLIKKIEIYLGKSTNYPGIGDIEILESVESGFLIDFLCSYLPFSAIEKQSFLETETLEQRARILYKILGLTEVESNLIELNKTMH